MNKIAILTILLIIGIFYPILAQVEDSTRIETPDTPDTSEAYRSADQAAQPPRTSRPPAKITGDFGIYGELYSVSGRDKRRPSSSGRIFIRPTLTLLGTFRTSLDIIYSTEGSSARQSINQFAIHPSWSWGTFHFGDFSHKFSDYTLSGITIRGGGVEINPGLLRLQAIGGQTKRKVESTPESSVYSQYAYGVKLGVGRDDGSYFDINMLKVKDDKGSLPLEMFQSDTTGNDSKPDIGITPQENLVLGANTVLNLFQKKLTFKGEFAGAAFTRNLYSSEELGEDIPSVLTNIYSPRISSNFDYAYRSEATFRHSIFNLKGGYSYIGPGYTSLGITSNINDKQTIDGGLGLRFFRSRLSIQTNLQLQNDNVADQKENTTTRTTFSITTNARPTNQLSFMFNVMNNVMKNDNADSTLIVRDSVYQEFDSTWIEPDTTVYYGEIHNINSSYTANVMYMFMINSMSQNVNLNYSTQFSKDKNPSRAGNNSHTQNIMFSAMSMLNRIWTLTTTINYNIIDIESQDKIDRTTLGLQISNRLFNGKLSNSLGGNYALADDADVLGINLSSNLSLSRKDSIRLTIKSSIYSASGSTTEDYEELMAGLGFNHKF